MGRKRGEFYVNPEELKSELESYRENSIMSEELGVMILTIAKKFTNHWKFRRYPPTMREDMVGKAVIRIIEQIDMIDLDHPKCNPFSYLTKICFNVYIAECTKHYKYENLKANLTDMYFNEMENTEGIVFNKNIEDEL